VHRSIKGVRSIKPLPAKHCFQIQKIPSDKRTQMPQASLRSHFDRPINLALVNADPDDLTAREPGDFSSWSADTAADVENFHPWAQGHEVREPVFVERHGEGDGLVRAEGRVVE
jgi:hypothetical protein